MSEDFSNWKGCPEVYVPEAKGKYVQVRPLSDRADGHELWQALGGPEANDYIRYFPVPNFTNADSFYDWLEKVQGSYKTALFVDQESSQIMGMANYMRNDAANGVVEIGAIAHGKKMAGTPAATEGQYLLARHVFEELGYRRYEWKCHNENAPSKRAAIRLGFESEGVFRQHIISRGRNRDTAWFAMIDKDWPVIGAAFKAWLDPSNFDDEEMQIKTLEEIRIATRGDDQPPSF
ncbi:MAG: GNAT family N-acetyltransferase [Rhizobiaceae bacterium]